MSFDIEHEWVEVAPSPDEIAHRTMAKLHIRVNGQLVTAVKDHQHKFDREYVLVPLHHVAEWLVANWHHLLYEAENSSEPQRPGFASRHNLAFAGDGFILPQLTIVPTDGATVMRWVTSKPKFSEIEFMRYGEERISTDEMESACRSSIEAVLDKMRQENLPVETLEESWQAICELDEEERDFARAAALLGADPFEIDDELANGIVEFWQGIPPSLREDALGGGNVGSLPLEERWLKRGLEVLDEQQSAVATSRWMDIRNSVSQSNSTIPWQNGYGLAQNLRREMAGDSSCALDSLGGNSEIPYCQVHSVSARLQGLVAADSPVCVGTARSDSSRRFLQARSIGAFLSSSGSGPSLLSTMATDFQVSTRAFAAEFLAPAEQLRVRMKGGRTSVTALAHEFRVSKFVIAHQIKNHHLGYVAQD